MTSTWYDAVVVGAGFGGLGTALELTRRGARVALCETFNYPGGCASTLHRHGFAFESAACASPVNVAPCPGGPSALTRPRMARLVLGADVHGRARTVPDSTTPPVLGG
jgi:cation diffusion facilitator CzcD-associated flavoprotein CzcO